MKGEMIADTTTNVAVLAEFAGLLAAALDKETTARLVVSGPKANKEALRADGLGPGAAAETLKDVVAALTPQRGGRRGRAPSNDDGAEALFLPHDVPIALLQSVFEACIDQRQPQLAPGTDGRGRRRSTPADPPMFTDRRLAVARVSGPKGRRLGTAFESTDIRWAASMFWWGLRQFSGKHPFKDDPAEHTSTAERCKVVIVGDWASGLPRAQKVASTMRTHIAQAKAEGVETHVIHLGDTYYSGLPREYEHRFLPYWPVEAGEQDLVRSWSLNGNHDMYSGGWGYFDVLLADPRFACQQQSSWFVIDHPHWRFIGLDTAWDQEDLHDRPEDGGLPGRQADVVNELVAKGDKKTVLLSHHPLFGDSKIFRKRAVDAHLKKVLGASLEADGITAWFWGHLHGAEAFKAAEHVAYPRLVGHGGVPMHGHLRGKGSKTIWREDRKLRSQGQKWAIFGFAVLDVGPDAIEVTYYQEDGDTAWVETIR